MKESIHDLLNDKEVAEHLIIYTDNVYARYLGKGGKLWSTIGGVQKGVNFALEEENPLMGLLGEGDDISLSSIAKGFLKNALSKNKGQQPQKQQTQTRTGSVPNM